VIGVASLAIHMHDSTTSLDLGPFKLDLGASTLPLALSITVWTGGRAGFVAAFMVHGLLRRLHRTTFVDYGVTGACAELGVSALMHGLGMSHADWLVEAVLGAASGLLYRLFAGMRAA
jgi:hypothetical protein